MASLPLGFAEQVIDLQIRLEDDKDNLQVIQILSQMYRIGVDYYIDQDLRKASFFQKKLNNLAVQSLSAISSEVPQKKHDPSRKIKHEIRELQMHSKTYIQSIVENSTRNQQKLQHSVSADLKKQQDALNGRLLKRVKSKEQL